MPAGVTREPTAAKSPFSDVTLDTLKRSLHVSGRRHRHKTIHVHKPGSGGLGLPKWAAILIAVGVVSLSLFVGGLVYHWDKERKRANGTGKPMNRKKVVWGATTWATGLVIPIYIYHAIKHRSWSGKPSSYDEIEEEQHHLNDDAPQTETKPWMANQSPSNSDSKYEPMGYNPPTYDPSTSSYAGAEPAGQISGVGAPGPVEYGAPPPGLYQPPPPHQSGDLGRTPSPPPLQPLAYSQEHVSKY